MVETDSVALLRENLYQSGRSGTGTSQKVISELFSNAEKSEALNRLGEDLKDALLLEEKIVRRSWDDNIFYWPEESKLYSASVIEILLTESYKYRDKLPWDDILKAIEPVLEERAEYLKGFFK